MMVKCVVVGCSSDSRTCYLSNEGISFFRFPKDAETKVLWTEKVQKLKSCDWIPTNGSRICSRHFTTDSWYTTQKGVRLLFATAIPTLHLDKKNSTVMSCAVVNCGSDGQNQRTVFFPFPKDPNLCKIWKYACGRSDDFCTDKAVICELHFEKSDYETHVLRNDYSEEGIKQFRQVQLNSSTIPTLNLPEVSEMITQDVSISEQSDEEVKESEVATDSYAKECAVANCSLRNQMFCDFPDYKHQKTLFDKWKWICRNENLESLRPEDVSKRYGICEGHFDSHIVILPDLLPTKDVPDLEIDPMTAACEARQMCRLCFNVGSVDLFSYRYYQTMLKDIAKCFIPIEIRKTDTSTLVCENCKCELIRFYNFLLKSLRVNEYLQSMSKEAEEEIPLQQEDDVEDDECQTVKMEEAEEEPPLELEESEELIEIRIDVEPKASDAKNLKKRKESVKKPKLDDGDKNKDDIIICIHCNAAVGSLEELYEHCKQANHAPVVVCANCNQMFKTEEELAAHSECHKKNRSCVCDRCGKQFSKRDGLYSHLSKVHNKDHLKYACKECPKKFATNYRLTVHMRVHTNDRPYCCETCGAVFTRLINLRNHQALHTDRRPYVCLICNKGFRRRYLLTIHLTKHTGERKYGCEKCGITYKRQVNLRRHNKRHHPDPSRLHVPEKHKSYTCVECDLTFKNYQRYYVHTFRHNPSKKIPCKHCDKRFRNGALLKKHMVVHTGKKNFECELCEKRFSQRPHLQSHLLVHTGEKPYKCKYCTKSFAHQSTLVVHERIHTGETPYVCQFCKKGFYHSTNFKKHVLSQHGVLLPKTVDYSTVKKVDEDEDEGEDDNTE